MATIAELFAQAVAFHGRGQLSEAVGCYEQVVRADPSHAEAYKNLGYLLAQQGKVDEAIARLQQAVSLSPAVGDVAGYVDHLMSVRDNQRGNALAAQDRWEEAAACYRQAIERTPNFAEAHYNLALGLVSRNQLDAAIASFEQGSRLRPDLPEISADLHLALALRESHRGSALSAEGKLDEAAACFDRALAWRPDSAEAHFNLANAALEQGKLAEAEANLRLTLQFNPDYAPAHSNLAFALLGQHKLDEAAACGQRAVQLAPADPDAHYNHAFTLLTMGRLAEGWEEFEWRWKNVDGGEDVYLGRPRWTGSPLAGRTILLRGEQGSGDTLQFIRYVDAVQQPGVKVLVEVRQPLVPLLMQSKYANLLVTPESPRDFDVHIPLMGLPRLFSTTVETIPGGVPYLAADPRLVEHWGAELHTISGFNVGIAWQGNPYFPGDRFRSFHLSHFAPLAREGVALISLQKGLGAEQLAEVPGKFPVRDFGTSLDEQHGPFMDTAALLKNLDLVITSDSAVAHLAGALGVPVWLALAFTPDWRWLLNRDDSPWYPTMRLFRQQRPQDWTGVFERIAAELERLLG